VCKECINESYCFCCWCNIVLVGKISDGFIGQTEHYLENLTESIPKLQGGEILVSFDVVSLFIKFIQFIHSTLSHV